MHAQTHSTKSQRINQEIQELKREDRERRIKAESPDGRPANPLMRMRDVLWLVVGSITAVLVISIACFFVWGFGVGAMVLGLGIVLAVIANPIVWAIILRGKEREEVINEEPSRTHF